jgi:hypothetical protein
MGISVSSSMLCLWKEEVPRHSDKSVYFSFILLKKNPDGTETECRLILARKNGSYIEMY